MLPKLPLNVLVSSSQLVAGQQINALSGLLTGAATELIATPNGTAINSVALNSAFNEIKTVANPNDSVTLPIAKAGLRVFVNNAGANNLKIWCYPADNINGSSSITIDNGANPIWFVCYKDGSWYIPVISNSVSPEFFGAVGDGVADDTVAVQKAFNKGGRIIGIGKYFVTNTINIVSNSTLENLNIIAGPANAFTPQSHLPLVFGNNVTNVVVFRCSFDISAWTAIPNGVNSLRALHFYVSSDISVIESKFTTTGGATSFRACSKYLIRGNRITCAQPGVSASGFADGVIDNWAEQNTILEKVVVTENTIIGNGWARWGIMFTGLTFGGFTMDVRNIVISNNVISNTFFDGMWAFGRSATIYDTTITGNTINSGRIGISVSDGNNVAVTGNTIQDMSSAGIYFWSENAGSPALGVNNSVISANNLYNVASSGVGTPPALWLDFTSLNNLVANNNIDGTSHYFGISCQAQTANNTIRGNRITTGRNSNYSVNLAANNTIDGAAYTPILSAVLNVAISAVRRAHAYCSSNKVTVFFSITATPTAASAVSVGMSLPYPSDIVDFTLFGSGCTTNGLTASVVNDNANNQALVNFTPATTAAHVINGSFSYDIQ